MGQRLNFRMGNQTPLYITTPTLFLFTFCYIAVLSHALIMYMLVTTVLLIFVIY